MQLGVGNMDQSKGTGATLHTLARAAMVRKDTREDWMQDDGK